ncbi:DUF7620 family protein [Streptomyces zhihengii]
MIAWIRRLARGRKSAEPTEAEEALERTRTDRQAAEARQPVVEAVVEPLRRALRENHLSERIELAFAERRGVQR